MNIERDIMDIKGVSEYTTLSINTIYKKVSRGEIPFHKIGNRTLFVKNEINDWIINDGKIIGDLPELRII